MYSSRHHTCLSRNKSYGYLHVLPCPPFFLTEEKRHHVQTQRTWLKGLCSVTTYLLSSEKTHLNPGFKKAVSIIGVRKIAVTDFNDNEFYIVKLYF